MSSNKLLLPVLIFSSLVFLPVVSAAKPSSPSAIKERVQNRLTEVKLKVCQNKEQAITSRINRLSNLSINMEENFASHSARVQDYYTQKVLPSGKSVANYAALVADISTKKSTVDSAMSQARTRVFGFSCTGDDPKGQLNQYRLEMQNVKQALQQYRTSVKNLLVAVRSAKSV